MFWILKFLFLLICKNSPPFEINSSRFLYNIPQKYKSLIFLIPIFESKSTNSKQFNFIENLNFKIPCSI